MGNANGKMIDCVDRQLSPGSEWRTERVANDDRKTIAGGSVDVSLPSQCYRCRIWHIIGDKCETLQLCDGCSQWLLLQQHSALSPIAVSTAHMTSPNENHISNSSSRRGEEEASSDITTECALLTLRTFVAPISQHTVRRRMDRKVSLSY